MQRALTTSSRFLLPFRRWGNLSARPPSSHGAHQSRYLKGVYLWRRSLASERPVYRSFLSSLQVWSHVHSRLRRRPPTSGRRFASRLPPLCGCRTERRPWLPSAGTFDRPLLTSALRLCGPGPAICFRRTASVGQFIPGRGPRVETEDLLLGYSGQDLRFFFESF